MKAQHLLRITAAAGAALALSLTAAPALAAQEADKGLINCTEISEGSSGTIEGAGCEVVTWAEGSGPYEVWNTTTTAAYLCQVVLVRETHPLSVSGSFCSLIA
ncbi:hypothetical protein [Streptomyces sp. B6B3]|uniref:hypothetical protein n=1 Tax=Streptomyces sp. B6B3 TaxID=3153570 RepID=UPI00325D30FD